MAKSLFSASKLAWPSGYDESTLSMAMLVVMICRRPSAYAYGVGRSVPCRPQSRSLLAIGL
jgi:hypothetical protein